MATVELLDRSQVVDIINDKPGNALAQEVEHFLEEARQSQGKNLPRPRVHVLPRPLPGRPVLLLLERKSALPTQNPTQNSGGNNMMQRWTPFQDLRQMQDTMDHMWHRFGDAPTAPADPPEIEAWAVPLDVVRSGEDTLIRASMPGVNPEDIHVSIEDNVLTIKGQTAEEHQEGDGAYLMRERRSGSFHRALRLPDSVDPDQVPAPLQERRF